MASPDGLTALILAGGLGSRLRPVTGDGQKVVAEVAGRPFLDHLLAYLAAQGVTQAVLALGHRADAVVEHLQRHPPGLLWTASVEAAPLGTGGAIRHALPHLPEAFLVVNGDSFCDADLGALRRFHQARRAQVTLTLHRVADAGRYGRVELDEEGRITAFCEKSGAGAGLINAGLYFMQRRVAAALPAGNTSLEREVLPALVAQGSVFGLQGGTRFIDIGTPESWLAAQRFFAA